MDGALERPTGARLRAFRRPPKSGRVLDVGSGTGALAAALLADVADATVVGIEPAEAYVAYSSARLRDERLRFEIGDALAIPFEDDGFDAALSLLILQELPDVPRAVREMRRVTRPGGRVAASQWDFADGMPMLALFWDAVVEVVDSDAARRAAADCMVVDHPDEGALRRLWQDAGLVEIVTERHEIAMDFTAFDDYWSPFLSGVTPTSSFIDDLNADSLDLVDLTIAIEEEFSSDDGELEITEGDAEKLGTVQDVMDFLAQHGIA